MPTKKETDMYNTEAGVLPYQQDIQQSIVYNVQAATSANALRLLKKGIWLYFWLLLFEGALRKWVVPGLATPLLVIRDPIAIWLLVYAYMYGMLKSNFYITIIWVIGAISFITTMLLGHGDLVVAIYGARILLFHFPLIFVIGSLFTYKDVVQMAKAVVLVTIPMTILMAMQFYSPQSAWVNRSIGGVVLKRGFTGALGYFRPSGVFSFTNGLSAFYGLSAAIIFYFWLNGSKTLKKWVLITATVCLFAAIPLSISRTVFFSVILSGAFVFAIGSQKPKYIGKILTACTGGIILFFILGNLGIFKTGVEVFASRFESASNDEGGVEGTLTDRFLGGMVSSISSSSQFPFWGMGMGMGTNAGSQLLSGKVQYLISEGEWGRLIGEMGVLLGLTVIILRINLTLQLGISCFRQLKKENFLPWMLFSFGMINIMQGQWAQPTALGFSIIAGGMIVASLKKQSR